MKVLKVLFWILLVVVIVFLALFISSKIAGFATLSDMLDYIYLQFLTYN